MSATVTSPRRVAADRARVPSHRSVPPRTPRRVSGPASGRVRTAAAPRESIAIGERALALVRGLPDHSLIDRLVRGRAWIPVLGVLLVGIVAMQVEILKLGSTMGRAVERSSVLQSQNESLRASVAALADDQRIERLAAGMGMSMPTPDSLVFLRARPDGAVGGALGNIHAPDPAGFVSQLAAQAAAAAALLPPPPPSTSSSATSTGTSATGTSTTTTSTTGSAATPTGQTTAVASPAAAPTAPTTGTPTTGAPATGAAPGAGAPGSTSSAPSGAGGSSATGAAGVAPPGTAQSGGATGG